MHHLGFQSARLPVGQDLAIQFVFLVGKNDLKGKVKVQQQLINFQL